MDWKYLETITDKIKSRPLSRKKNSRTKRHEPIKAHTVKIVLTNVYRALDWIDDHSDSYNWEAPQKMNKLFKVSMDRIMTRAERDKMADGVLFSIPWTNW